MASIEKIYGTIEQHDEFSEWVKENKPELLKYFYQKEVQVPSPNIIITNLPEWADKWLLENCPIKWVTYRIKEQYCIESVYDYMSFMGIEDE